MRDVSVCVVALQYELRQRQNEYASRPFACAVMYRQQHKGYSADVEWLQGLPTLWCSGKRTLTRITTSTLVVVSP